MKVRAKKSLGQHFLTDLSVAQRIVASLVVGARGETAGIGGVGVEGGETGAKEDGKKDGGLAPVGLAGAEKRVDGGETVTVGGGCDGKPCDNWDIHCYEGELPNTEPNAKITPNGKSVTENVLCRTNHSIGNKNNPATEGQLRNNGDVRTEASETGSGAVSGGGVHSAKTDVLEVGPGTGVLTQYLLQRDDIALKMVELDREAVYYLLATFPQVNGALIEADFLHLRLENLFAGNFYIIGNFPYNISSQIFFKVLDYRDRIPQVVCMIQKEVAERIAEKPGSKTYGILSVLLQAWYDIEYLFSVGPNSFRPAPKVNSAVIRLTRNSRTELGCDEKLFKAVVKTAFNQRRKTLRNSLKSMILEKVDQTVLPGAGSGGSIPAGAGHEPANPVFGGAGSGGSVLESENPALVGSSSETVNPTHTGASDETFINVSESALAEAFNQFTADPIFDLRPEKLSVEDFIALTLRLTP